LIEQDIMTYFGGFSRNADGSGGTYWNDIWVSRDRGVRWALITDHAPWAERDNLNAEVTPDGIMVLTAGYNSREALNDVWISADGGWSWGNCLAEASFSDRRWEMTALDASGYLYIIGGEEYISNTTWAAVNDVWKSTFAIRASERTRLQKACNIVWPSCTTGLSCYPGSGGTRVTYDQQGRAKVTCPLLTECYIPSDNGDGSDTAGSSGDAAGTSTSSSGSSISTSTAALIAVLVIAVVFGLGYWYYRSQQSAQDTSKLAIKLDAIQLLGMNTSDAITSPSNSGASTSPSSSSTSSINDTNPLNISLISHAQPL